MNSLSLCGSKSLMCCHITGGLRSSAIILQNGQLSSCKIKSKLLITQSFLLEISFSILHDREGSNYTKGHFRYRDGPHWCCLLSVNHILKIKYISGLDLQGTGYVMHPNIQYADELSVEWIAKLPWFEMPHRSRDIAQFIKWTIRINLFLKHLFQNRICHIYPETYLCTCEDFSSRSRNPG